MVRAILLGILLLASCFQPSFGAGENDWFVPLGKPPEAPPKRISGGEGFAPLPLPATPLRRTERKREPTPPSLFGKVVWGEQGSFTYDGVKSTKITDWNLCPPIFSISSTRFAVAWASNTPTTKFRCLPST